MPGTLAATAAPAMAHGFGKVVEDLTPLKFSVQG
jgi:hypothetical protein